MEKTKLIHITGTKAKKNGTPYQHEFPATVESIGDNVLITIRVTNREVGRTRIGDLTDSIIKIDDKVYKAVNVTTFVNPIVPIIQAVLIA